MKKVTILRRIGWGLMILATVLSATRIFFGGLWSLTLIQTVWGIRIIFYFAGLAIFLWAENIEKNIWKSKYHNVKFEGN